MWRFALGIGGLVVVTVSILVGTADGARAQEGGLVGDLAPVGVSLATWGGGPVDSVVDEASVQGCNLVSVWVNASGGGLVGYIPTLIAAVNQPFFADYPEGILPSGIPVLIVCREGDGGVPLQVFFSRHPESDDDPSAVFPVDRVAPNAGVARFATEELIAGPSLDEQSNGLFSTWASFVYSDDSDCGGAQFTINIEGGVATVRFCVSVQLLGVIADGQAQSTLMASLEQFPTVNEVVILTRSGDCMFDLSGMNLCLQGN